MAYATDGGGPGPGPPFEPPGPPPWAPGPPPWAHPANPARWALIYYAHSWLDGTLHVYCETDTPVHLYLRWTDKEEQIHLHSATDRGLTKMSDPKYCFVEWKEVEQNEAGDTFKHTFSFAGWAHCNWRWWMFRGTVTGLDTPSNTCIFSAHYLDQEKAVSLKHTDLLEKEVADVIDHADDSIPGAKMKAGFTWPFFPLTPSAAPAADYEAANKKYVDDALQEAALTGLMARDIHLLDDFTNWKESKLNTGATLRDVTLGHVDTGAGANSLACIYADLYLWWQINSQRFSINYDWPFMICFFAGLASGGAAANRYNWLRLSVDITGGDLAQPGVGWRWNRNGSKLYSQTHDGAGLESILVSTGYAWHQMLHRYRTVHNPGVDIKFYIDDTLMSTHTVRVPAGIQTNAARVSLGAENPGSAASIEGFINRFLIAKDWRTA